jgi:hypothetical protein
VFQFFGVSGAPAGENESRTETRFCVGQDRVQVTGAKMHPNPHPLLSGAKPVGDPKPESELPSLVEMPEYCGCCGKFV